MNKEILEKLGFKDEVELVELGRCPLCKQKIDKGLFKYRFSLREYEISGLCQRCQDYFFESRGLH